MCYCRRWLVLDDGTKAIAEVNSIWSVTNRKPLFSYFNRHNDGAAYTCSWNSNVWVDVMFHKWWSTYSGGQHLYKLHTSYGVVIKLQKHGRYIQCFPQKCSRFLSKILACMFSDTSLYWKNCVLNLNFVNLN